MEGKRRERVKDDVRGKREGKRQGEGSEGRKTDDGREGGERSEGGDEKEPCCLLYCRHIIKVGPTLDELMQYKLLLAVFYQRISIASYANHWYSQSRNVHLSVCPSICLSVTLRYCVKTKKASVGISSPSESLNILVSRNIWFISKFDRGYPERGRFLRLGV